MVLAPIDYQSPITQAFEPYMSDLGQAPTDAIMSGAQAVGPDSRSSQNPDDSIHRDSAIWFEDGNIVAIAQNTAFRFHKGVLSLHSQVFRDLFSVPQPSSVGSAGTAQTFDGYPAVHVTDTSYDFRELLRAIYYGGVSHLHPDEAVTLPVLAALARLSHKYQLDQLLDAVILRLKRTFTTDFETWERSGCLHEELSPMQISCSDCIEALNLFRLLDKTEMIPVALYGCSQLEIADLFSGVTRHDGVTPEGLSPHDLQLCLEIKLNLTQTAVSIMMALCDAVQARITQVSSNQGCFSPVVCGPNLAAFQDRIRHHVCCHINGDPLALSYSCQVDSLVDIGRICRSCGDATREAHLRLRREVWMILPDRVGLDIDGWGSAYIE
ncbi:hypothetical protein LXA43DRAFT_358897 [Ganoderma leucocontextum]|nr:hypothetical protein LXA43DRAFT_358897 [Ganoderma leucocontextum]